MSIAERFALMHPGSETLHRRALPVFPDGVTHRMRRQSPFPLYVMRAAGSRKWDVDGHEIIDYVMGHGALLLGHGHPAVVEAVAAQARLGTHYGASHELEVRWGECVQALVASAERVRFTSSGTEATMMALRLARGATGREQVMRLRDHFHGWNDAVTGQPRPENTLPEAHGVPRGMLDASIVIAQDDTEGFERTIDETGDALAAVIFEATGSHWGTDPIDLAFVRRMREVTAQRGIVLIMDEVITGFRIAPGGAQQAYRISPDLTTFAKILGGGLPGGAVAGRADLMDQIGAPGGDRITHPGTFNGNPLSAAAGVACLDAVADGSHQERATATAAGLARELNSIFDDESVAGTVYGQSSMLHIALGMEERPPDGYSWGWQALPSPRPRVSEGAASALRLGMLNEGVDLMGDGMMVSSVHDAEDVARTVDAFRATLRAMKAEGAIAG